MTPPPPVAAQTPVHHSRVVVWLGWLVAHLIPVIWIDRFGTATGDVHYYFVGVNNYVPGAMTEYPVFGTLPARLVNLLPGGEDD